MIRSAIQTAFVLALVSGPGASEQIAYQVPQGFTMHRPTPGPSGTTTALLVPGLWCASEAAYEIREGRRVATFDASGRLLWQASARGILEINATFVQQDGQILVWGLLLEGSGRTGGRDWLLFRFGPGGLDRSFHALRSADLADLRLTSVQLAADDVIEIEGSFTSVRGQPRAGRARLRPDGSLEE